MLFRSGNSVRTKQVQLNRISRNYPSIPKIAPVDGVFGQETDDAVREFQRIFKLTADGIIGKATWYRIAYLYNSVKRLSELDSEGISLDEVAQQFPSLLSPGDTGDEVRMIQYYLQVVAAYYDTVPPLTTTGVYDDATYQAVMAFQRTFGLTPDGIMGQQTWNELYKAYRGILDSTAVMEGGVVLYPGTVLRIGSQGEYVQILQEYLAYISEFYPEIPAVQVTGVFGNQTQAAVIAFQNLFGLEAAGIVGPLTWDAIASLYSDLRVGNDKQPGQFPGTELAEGETT